MRGLAWFGPAGNLKMRGLASITSPRKLKMRGFAIFAVAMKNDVFFERKKSQTKKNQNKTKQIGVPMKIARVAI